MNKDRYQHITDNELLENFYADRDNKWLGLVLQRFTLLLYGVCMKYLRNEEEAKDAVQQVFLKAINELHKYKVEYFKSWIYMVAKNHCLMKLRDRQGKIPVELTEDTFLAAEDTGIETYLDKDRLLSSMEIALHELNTDQKQCVTLFYLDKKSYQEITDATGHTMMQVKSHIQNGKRNLKLLIEKKLKTP
ncbi:MAG: sigma-70 family RNA polymerase sigma factor [Gemmatimonadaceae bacterium]|nr:sigma-70 family RNA polymerase sigma factor [Chitinophagaceae bacterium]